MNKHKSILAILGLILICLVFVGCKDLLISGTFVFVETFEYTADNDFYFYQVDITKNPDWDEHKDKIDFVDAVGVEFFITSTETTDVTFNAYIDRFDGIIAPPASLPGSETQIIDDLTISPGVSHITYKQSLGFLTGLDSLKAYAKLGQFNYYGMASGNTGGTFTIDSAKVVVTLSASE